MYTQLAARGQLRTIATAQIRPNPDQPRRTFDPDALRALATSIDQLGILQPPLVRDRQDGSFELIAGERRWRAAKLAGLTNLQVIVHPTTLTNSALSALVENLQREDLDPVDEAAAYAAVIHQTGMSVQALADHLGKSRPEISNTLRLRDLTSEVLEHLRGRRLTKAHGRALLTEPDPAQRAMLAHQAADHGWSVRRLETEIATPQTNGPPPATPNAPAAAHTATPAAARPGVERSATRADLDPQDRGEDWSAVAAALTAQLGHPARIGAYRGGVRVILTFASVADVEAFTASQSAAGDRRPVD